MTRERIHSLAFCPGVALTVVEATSLFCAALVVELAELAARGPVHAISVPQCGRWKGEMWDCGLVKAEVGVGEARMR